MQQSTRYKLTSGVDHVPLAIDKVALGIVAHLDGTVHVHCAAAACGGLCCIAGSSVPVVLLMMVLLQRRATAATRARRHQRTATRLGGLLLLLLLLRAARAAAAQRFQFSLGRRSRGGCSGAGTVGDVVVDGCLH